MDQLDLWAEPQPFTAGFPHASVARPIEDLTPDFKRMFRADGPETSIQSAKHTISRLTESKQKVYDCLAQHPEGLCDEQIALHTLMKESSASKRRFDLTTDGLVVYAGHTTKTSTGCNAKVWRLA